VVQEALNKILLLSETAFTHVKLVVENSTDFKTWQILNHNLTQTGLGSSTKLDVTIPAVALGSGYITYYVPIPRNSGTIDRISIKAKEL